MYTIKEKAVSINVDTYVENYHNPEKFVQFCKECNRYNACWSCPPFDFDVKSYLLKYNSAWIIGTQIFPEEPEEKIQNKENAILYGERILIEIRKKLDPLLLSFENKYPGSRAFFAGTCHYCPLDKCTRKEQQPCIHPKKIRPSLEAFGFDIEHTASDLLGIDLLWGRNGKLPQYYTLVSAVFTQNKIEKLL